MADNYSRDPDALYDDQCIMRIQIVVRRDGALGVSGGINGDLNYILACLDEAKNAVRKHHERMNQGKVIVTPAYDMPKIILPG